MFYQEELLDHYKNPRHHGALAHPDFSSGSYNPSCGDSSSFSGIIKNNILVEVAQQGSGCVISQAAASMLAQKVVGKSISSILDMTSDDMVALIGIQLGPTRLRCALLPLEALTNGIKEYQASSSDKKV